MTIFVPIAMFGWLAVVVLLFAMLPPRRAVLTAFIGGWLFLPMAAYSLPGLPDYTKMSATCFGILGAVILFDARRLMTFRPAWFDLPMAIWCVCPFASSMSNGLGPWDGFTAAVAQTVTWGLPYLIGRMYFNDMDAIRELAIAVFIGGLIYIPFCLIEMRISPQLHRMVYGYHQHDFIQTIRGDGYRPMVFMQHGLMVAMWMTTAALLGFWLWRRQVLTSLFRIPMSVLVGAVSLIALLSRSFGAMGLLVVGAGALWFTTTTRSRLALIVILAVPGTYMTVRATGMWDGRNAVRLVESTVGLDRSRSLSERFRFEGILLEKARQQPVYGWGGWGRNRVYNDRGDDITKTDGLWIITLGKFGVVGLVSMTLMMQMPLMLVTRKVPPAMWGHPTVAPLAVLAIIPGLYAVDCLPNAMINPIFILIVGALTGMAGRMAPLRAPRHRMPRSNHRQMPAMEAV